MKILVTILFLLTSASSSSMEFNYEIDSNLNGKLRDNVEIAIKNIQRILVDDEYWERVNEVDSFTCTDETTPSIQEIRQMKIEFKLRKYWHFKKKVKAKTVGKTISLNSRAGARTPEALSNTIFHEMLHVAGLGHCGVNNISKYPYIKDSIPYTLGSILEDML